MSEVCDYCSGSPAAFRCSGCHQKHYCDRTCQKRGWVLHKRECKHRGKMTQKCMFHQMPLDMMRNILEYLNSWDLVYLDNAMTNKFMRPVLLDAMSYLRVIKETPLEDIRRDESFHNYDRSIVNRPMGTFLSRSRLDMAYWLTRRCARMEHLDVVNIKELDDINETLLTICTSLGQINQLLLMSTHLTDEGAAALTCLGRLTSLSLIDVHILPNALEKILSSAGATITQLDFRSSRKFTDSSLVTVMRYCTRLQRLSVSDTGVTAAGLSALAGKCPHLTHLNVSNISISPPSARGIRVNQLTHLATILEAEPRPLLKYFCATNLFLCKDGLETILVNNATLPRGGAGTVTNSSLHTLDLRDLQMGLDPAHDIALMKLLADRCNSLTQLDLSNGSSRTMIGKDALRALSKGCPKLRFLTLLGEINNKALKVFNSFSSIGGSCEQSLVFPELEKLLIDWVHGDVQYNQAREALIDKINMLRGRVIVCLYEDEDDDSRSYSDDEEDYDLFDDDYDYDDSRSYSDDDFNDDHLLDDLSDDDDNDIDDDLDDA